MKKFYLFIAVALVSFSSSEDIVDKIVAGFKKYLQEFPQEKVYLHTDRPYYTDGDTIWFKAYLIGGTFHEPSQLSHTVYVELIDANGKLIKQSKLLVANSSAASNIALPDSIASGNYLLRAYTHWMKNNDEDYFFHRIIKVWNKAAPIPTTSFQAKELDIQFFPEGGNLVNGIVSKVAFKAIGSDGLGVKVNGKVVDESNKTISEFKSNALGMGTFFLIPQKGKSYRAIIENHRLELKLPQAKRSGLVMSVKNSSNSKDITVRLQTSDSTNLKVIYIIAQTRGIICFTATANISAQKVVVKIPKTKIPAGITQITIVDSNGVLLAERLVFIEEKPLSVKVSTDKKVYTPHELVKLQIEVTDSTSMPVQADLSLAVCDDILVPLNNNCENINDYLLLSSELKGYVQTPGYYFNVANADREMALDFLLLTQGWRRFTIKKALEPWQEPQYKIEQGLTLKGKMVDAFNKKPIVDGSIVYMTAIPPNSKIVQTNAYGLFEINNAIYFDSAQVVLQGQSKKGAKSIKFSMSDEPDFPSVHFPNITFDTILSEKDKSFIAKSLEREHIKSQYKTVELKEVVVRANKVEQEPTGSKIYGNGSATVQVAGNPAMENMFHPLQVVQGRVAGVTVTGSGLNWNVIIRGVSSLSLDSSPLILIDDMPVSMDALSSINVHDIEKFTVWKGPDAAAFGIRGANGAIGFYTKKGGGFTRPSEGIYTFKEVGFQTEREFYSPKYEVKKPTDTRSDKRITLAWMPHIKTDSTGNASVSFYNDDEEKEVSGILEGISSMGKPAIATFSYTIKKNSQ